MGAIILPFGSIATSKQSVALDYWELFNKNNFFALVLLGTVDAVPHQPVLLVNNKGNVEIFREGGNPSVVVETKLRPIDGERGHRRLILSPDRVLFGVGRRGVSGEIEEGVFRYDDPYLLSHYRFDGVETEVIGNSDDTPVDETGSKTGSEAVIGWYTDSGISLPITPLGSTRGLHIENGAYGFSLGAGASRDNLLSSGLVLDCFVDFSRSFSISIEDVPGGTAYIKIYRQYPKPNAVTFEYLSGGVLKQTFLNDVDLPISWPTGVAHLLIALQPSAPVMLGIDGEWIVKTSLEDFPDDFYELDFEQLSTFSVRLECFGSAFGYDAVYANLRLWDAEFAVPGASGQYTVPTTHDEVFPEFVSGIGIDLSGMANLPDYSTISRIYALALTGNTVIGDLTYYEDVTALILDRARYRVPQFDGDFPGLAQLEENTIVVENLAVDLFYNAANENFHGVVTGGLKLAPKVFDAVIIPKYSLDGERWYDCQDAKINVTTGLLADDPAAPFQFDWDFRDAVPSDGQEVNVYLTVIAYSPGAGLLFPDPKRGAIQITIGPEQVQTVSTTPDPNISVIDGTKEFEYTLTDRDSETVDIDFKYSIDNGITYVDATPDLTNPNHDGTTGLATSPTGINHIFAWDTLADGVRSKRALVRVTPKKKARRSPVLVADYRFNDRVVAAWDFSTGVPPLAITSGDAAEPQGLYGGVQGNIFDNYAGKNFLTANSLEVTTAGTVVGSIGIPRINKPAFATATRGFVLDARFDNDTADEARISIMALGGREMARFSFHKVDGLTVQLETGKGSFVLREPTALFPAGITTVRFYIKPTSAGVDVRYFLNGFIHTWQAFGFVKVLSLPRPAQLFSEAELYCVLSSHIDPAGAAKAIFYRVVLLDDEIAAVSFPAPVQDDPRQTDWLDPSDWPEDENSNFIGCISANHTLETGDRTDTALGIAGPFEIPRGTVGKQKLLRLDLFKYGFGLEFRAKILVGMGLQANVGGTAFEFVATGVAPGTVTLTVEDEFGVPTSIEYPYAGANWWPNNGGWHHFRMSVRRAPDYTCTLSVDGSAPISFVMPNLPEIFKPTGASPEGRQLLLQLLNFGGPTPFLIDDLKIWDGYHMSPYPIPVPEEPQYEYWKP